MRVCCTRRETGDSETQSFFTVTLNTLHPEHVSTCLCCPKYGPFATESFKMFTISLAALALAGSTQDL